MGESASRAVYLVRTQRALLPPHCSLSLPGQAVSHEVDLGPLRLMPLPQ